jgi:23S rRNA (adenine2030-N6)-methyltransferase
MLAYRHLFHAGNFADVFKHALLARLLIALERKGTAFCYLDTHAGIGRYDLNHPWAQKNAEWREGIARVWDRKDAPASLKPYLDAVRAENRDGRLRYYPGSPRIARGLVRSIDRLVLTELNRGDFEALKQRFDGDRRVVVNHMDGYQALKAFLPPMERRGLVMVDSSFDRAGEFRRVTQALAAAHKRWATGVYAIWYPLMEPTVMRAFERDVVGTGIRDILRLELSVRPDNWSGGLRGCGMLVVSPPFGFDREARPLLEWLWGALSPTGEGGRSARWLVPE